MANNTLLSLNTFVYYFLSFFIASGGFLSIFSSYFLSIVAGGDFCLLFWVVFCLLLLLPVFCLLFMVVLLLL